MLNAASFSNASSSTLQVKSLAVFSLYIEFLIYGDEYFILTKECSA